MPPALAHPDLAQPGHAAAFPAHRPARDRLPPALALPIILALSAIGWVALIQAARLVRAALLN